MTKYNLLYLEDDVEIIDNILYFIKDKFKNIYVAHNGKDALELYNTHEIDLLLLDINVPFINGLHLAEMIRKKNMDIPILMLTAHNETNKLLKSINLQINGYLLKPVKINELTNALDKMIYFIDKKNVQLKVVFFNYNYNWHIESEELTYLNQKIPLTKNEINFIKIMLKKKLQSLSFNEIKEKLFDDYDVKDNSIVQLVARLKRKAKKISSSDKFFIESIYQYGYKLSLFDKSKTN